MHLFRRPLGWSGLILLFAGILMAGAECKAQILWAGSGPEGGRVHSLAIDPEMPGRILAGTEVGGVYISRDYGHTWTAETSGLELLTVRDVVPVPGMYPLMFAATSAGIFRWGSEFRIWSPRSNGIDANITKCLVVDPGNNMRMLTGTTHGVYLTANQAFVWTDVSTGLGNLDVTDLLWDKPRNQIYACTAGGVYRADDPTFSWTPMNIGLAGNGLFTRNIAQDPADSNHFYLATGGGVYESTDGAATWQLRNTGLSSTICNAVWIDPLDGAHVLVGTEQGPSESFDHGLNWALIADGLQDNSIRSFVDSGQGLLAGSFHRGIYRRQGNTWVSNNQDFNNTLLWRVQFDADGGRLFAAGYGGTFRTSNGGVDFDYVPDGITAPDVRTVVVSPTDPQRVYTAANYGGVYRSDDGGSSYTLVGLSGETVRDIVCLPTNGNTLWAGTYSGVYYSEDGGGTWQSRSTGMDITRVNNIEMDPTDPQTLYVGIYLGYIYKTVDGGLNWSQIKTGLGADIVFDVDVSPFDSQLVIAGGIESKGIWRSTNGGASWTSSSTGLDNTSVWSVEFDPNDSNRVFAGTQHGVAVSYDGGLNWQDYSDGLTTTDIRDVKFHPTDSRTLAVATYGGGIFLHTETVTGTPGPFWKPLATLRPNYPNPFNPSTTLVFEVAGNSQHQVNLMVYDLRGRLVTTLGEETLSGGRYERRWNGLDRSGQRVASGSYLAVLRVDGQTAGSRKLTLVK